MAAGGGELKGPKPMLTPSPKGSSRALVMASAAVETAVAISLSPGPSASICEQKKAEGGRWSSSGEESQRYGDGGREKEAQKS